MRGPFSRNYWNSGESGARRLSSLPGLIATALLATAGMAAQTVPIYVDFGIGGTACCIVPDGHGGTWVAGTYRRSTQDDPEAAVRVFHLDSSWRTIGSGTWGNTATLQPGAGSGTGTAQPGIDSATAAALDPAGNLIVVGTTNSGKFPTEGPQLNGGSPGTGFVLRLDPNGNLLTSALVAAQPSAVAVGPDGSIFVGGTANSSAFPGIPGFRSPVSTYQGDVYAFAMKLAPTASAISWAAVIGSPGPIQIPVFDCGGDPASDCFTLAPSSTAVAGMAVTSDGLLTIDGNTNADIPTTGTLAPPGGAFPPPCPYCEQGPSFIMRFTADGTNRAWSISVGDVILKGLALDAAGDVVVGGTAPGPFYATPGAYQRGGFYETGGPMVMKINSSATTMIASTSLSEAALTTGMTLDSQGRIILNGTGATDLAVTAPSNGSDFVAMLSSDLTQLLSVFDTPAGSADAQVLTAPEFTVLGSSGSILPLPSGVPVAPALLGVMNAGGTMVSPQVSPGEFITLSGVFPGVVATTGVQVLFDGAAAPLLYVSGSQITAVVPFEIGAQPLTSTRMQIVLPGVTLPPVTLPVVKATPAILLITNADGSPFSGNNSVDGTETLAIWVEGTGLLTPPLATGEIAPDANSKPVLPLQLIPTQAGYPPLTIQSVSAVPGAIAGLVELKVSVTPESNGGVYQLDVGGTLSVGFEP